MKKPIFKTLLKKEFGDKSYEELSTGDQMYIDDAYACKMSEYYSQF